MTIWIRHLSLPAKEEETLTERSTLSLPLGALPDISMVTEPAQLRHLLAALHPEAPPETLDRMQEHYWKIGRAVDVEDIIAVPLKHKKIVRLAEVTEKYHYDTDGYGEDVHCVGVQWQKKAIPLHKFHKKSSMLHDVGDVLEEVTDPKTKDTLRSALPYSYNRFSALKWLIGVFILWRLFTFMTQRSGGF